MKRFSSDPVWFLLTVCLLLSSGVSGAPRTGKNVPYELDSRPGRQITISEKKFSVFQPGTGKLEIVIPEKSLKTVEYAARELKTFLDKRLRTDIPVVNAPTGKKYAIILGQNKWAEAAGIDSGRLCRDAFIIRTKGKNIYILGKDSDVNPPQDVFKKAAYETCYRLVWRFDSERATLFGVYDFLERFAGIRFYFPAEELTYIPRGAMHVPQIDIFDRPDFESRYFSPFHGALPYGRDQVKKHRFNVPADRFNDPEKIENFYRTRMQTYNVPNIHGLRWHRIPERFSKTHPEYLALLDPDKSPRDPRNRSTVHLCLTQGLLEVVKDDVRDYFQGKPKMAGKYGFAPEAFGYNGVSLSLPDGIVPCRCEKCTPYFKDPQSSSNLIWGFAAEVAKMLKKENYPGYVVLSAYSCHFLPPAFDLPDNIWPTLCLTGPWNILNKKEMARETEIFRTWNKKAGHKVRTWNYALKMGGTDIASVPNPTPRAFARYYKTVAPYICGSFVETATDWYIFNYLTYYVYGKISWDNSADPEKILTEHAQLLFGKGAPEIKAFFDELENIWLTRIYSGITESSFGPKFNSVTQEDVWEKIYSPAKIAQLEQYFSRAAALEKDDPEILKRLAFLKKNFIDPLKKGAQNYYQLLAAADSLSAAVSRLEKQEKIIIDGKADEKVWKHSEKIYLQKKNTVPGRKHAPTVLRTAADEKNLYLFFECSEPEIGSLQNFSGINGYQVEIFLQPDDLDAACLQLIVNIEGKMYQFRRSRRGPIVKAALDPRIKGKVLKGNKAWTAELQIPLAAVKGFDGKKMRANFCRQQLFGREGCLDSSWTPFLKRFFFEPDAFGILNFTDTPQNNLLKNGNFKEGLKHWGKPFARQGNSIALNEESFISHGKSIAVSTGRGFKKYFGQNQGGLRLKPDTVYQISFFAKAEKITPTAQAKSTRQGAYLVLRPQPGQKLLFFPKAGGIVGSANWKKYTYTFKTLPKSQFKAGKTGYLSLWMMAASGTVLFDNISITEVPGK